MDTVFNTIKNKKSENFEAYCRTHDVKYVADDAIFTNLSTGEEVKGRDAIAGMLQHIYHEAFNATAETTNIIIADKKAVLEAMFVGKHTGEFAGVPATGKQVRVPLCVTYDINEEGLIQKARIYMLMSVMMKQLEHGR